MVETKWITTRYFLKYIQISSGEKEIQSECRTAECYILGGSSIYLVHNVTLLEWFETAAAGAEVAFKMAP